MYSSDNKMQKLFEGFRKSLLNEELWWSNKIIDYILSGENIVVPFGSNTIIGYWISTNKAPIGTNYSWESWTTPSSENYRYSDDPQKDAAETAELGGTLIDMDPATMKEFLMYLKKEKGLRRSESIAKEWLNQIFNEISHRMDSGKPIPQLHEHEGDMNIQHDIGYTPSGRPVSKAPAPSENEVESFMAQAQEMMANGTPEQAEIAEQLMFALDKGTVSANAAQITLDTIASL